MDFVAELQQLAKEREISMSALAAEMGFSHVFFHEVLTGKRKGTARLAMAIWGRKGYDVTRDRLLSVLPVDTSAEFKKWDIERGQRRASKYEVLRKRQTFRSAASSGLKDQLTALSQEGIDWADDALQYFFMNEDDTPKENANAMEPLPTKTNSKKKPWVF